MDIEQITCIRCGTASDVSKYIVLDIPVCDSCLVNGKLKRKILIYPPKRIFLKKIRPLILAMLAGGILGCLGGLIFIFVKDSDVNSIRGFLTLLSSAVLGTIVFEFIFIILFYSRMQHAGKEDWKEHLVKELELENIIREQYIDHHLVTFAWQRPKWRNFTIPVNIGLMVESPNGLLFISTNGFCKIIPLESVLSTSTERLRIYPARTALTLNIKPEWEEKLGLPDSLILFAFMDQATFRMNKEKTMNMGKKLLA